MKHSLHGEKNYSSSVITDISPTSMELSTGPDVDADFLSVAYNPGQSVQASSSMFACYLESNFNMPTIFTVCPRDMNLLAIQSTLLGASLFGLNSVIVLEGDEGKHHKNMYFPVPAKSTEVIESIKKLTKGISFSGKSLQRHIKFSIGAVLDLQTIDEKLAISLYNKITAGADFIITQPIFSATEIELLHSVYFNKFREKIPIPLYYGIPVLGSGSLCFRDVPSEVMDLVSLYGNNLTYLHTLMKDCKRIGVKEFYVIPPFYSNGSRDYVLAKQFIKELRQMF
ncbi:MAG TPA: hypothetical protein DEZ08_01025 [Dehalococcoidia bacterium]|jgi:hypothetical protein|nr:hypothetical protein [Dehalococcoidia bacterium]